MKTFVKYILILIALFNASTIYAQNKGEILGKVIDKVSREGLSGITVRLVGTNFGAITNKEGRFKIRNIEPGIYTIQATGVGYEPFVEANISVTNTKPLEYEIELKQSTIQGQEIEVTTSYYERNIENAISSQSLNFQDIRRTPGAQEDVVRATQLLPGVSVTSAGRNDLIVRGGAPFENLFIVDNIEVPNINHFGIQGSTGGPLSLINIDFVKDVEFSSGTFPANFGDKTSSLTNITLRNGNTQKYTGLVNLSATGFGINAEGPLSSNSSAWISARRSYLDLVFKAAGFGFIPEYWDFQGKFNWNLNDKNQFSFLTIGAIDKVVLNNNTEENLFNNSRIAVPQQNQYFSALNWKRFFKSGFMNVTLGEYLSKFDTYQNDTTGTTVFKNISKEAETTLKTDFFVELNRKSNLTFGNQIKYATSLDYDIKIPGYLRTDFDGKPLPLAVDTSFNAIKNSTYISYAHDVGYMQYKVGARMDYYSFLQNKFYFSPRIAISYLWTERTTLSVGYGRFYQAPSYIWFVGDQNNSALKPIQADQIVFSFAHNPRPDVKIQLEIYQKWYNNYPARILRPYAVLAPSGFDDLTNDIPFGLEPLTSEGIGYSRGVEFFIQKKFSEIPLYGLFSLTLADTKFKSLKGDYIRGAYDSPVILNLTAGYRFNQEWELSGKFRLASGLPTTPFDEKGKRIYELYNQGERLPLYHALDVRLDKRWYFENFTLNTYIDIQNLYGRKNVATYRWNSKLNKVESQSAIGILPSIGVNLEI